jgi:hypothetical protein
MSPYFCRLMLKDTCDKILLKYHNRFCACKRFSFVMTDSSNMYMCYMCGTKISNELVANAILDNTNILNAIAILENTNHIIEKIVRNKTITVFGYDIPSKRCVITFLDD